MKAGGAKAPVIVMLGPAFGARGGIAAVANVYRRAGLLDRWPITYLPTHRDGNRLLKAGFAFAALCRYAVLLGSGKVALLHVHSASRRGFLRKSLFILISLGAGTPIVFHLHGAEFSNVYDEEIGPLFRAYIRFILDRSTAIVVLSERWRQRLRRITRNEAIHVIMNPILDEGAVDRRHDRHENGPPMLLFLGELGKRKGIHLLLEALARLEHVPWRLTIGGNGDIEGVREQARVLGIDQRVAVLGWVGGERKAELLRAATLLILPSFAEGLPMSVLEAMAHGVPVIATSVGGIPDLLVDGTEGILVPPGDVERLKDAIDDLLRHPDVAARMAARARRKFELSISANVIVPQIESLYSDLGLRPVETNFVAEPGSTAGPA